MSSEPKVPGAIETPDPFDLQRFVDAQRSVYAKVLLELRQGAKQSHWMWFVFPQLRGLGQSPMSQTYGIASKDGGRPYLAHPILGPRLIECTQLVLDANKALAGQIFPFPDDLKFRSSMTLFAEIAPDMDIFSAALRKYYGGEPDRETLRLLNVQ